MKSLKTYNLLINEIFERRNIRMNIPRENARLYCELFKTKPNLL